MSRSSERSHSERAVAISVSMLHRTYWTATVQQESVLIVGEGKASLFTIWCVWLWRSSHCVYYFYSYFLQLSIYVEIITIIRMISICTIIESSPIVSQLLVAYVVACVDTWPRSVPLTALIVWQIQNAGMLYFMDEGVSRTSRIIS